jgi:hypothetical protein
VCLLDRWRKANEPATVSTSRDLKVIIIRAGIEQAQRPPGYRPRRGGGGAGDAGGMIDIFDMGCGQVEGDEQPRPTHLRACVGRGDGIIRVRDDDFAATLL